MSGTEHMCGNTFDTYVVGDQKLTGTSDKAMLCHLLDPFFPPKLSL